MADEFAVASAASIAVTGRQTLASIRARSATFATSAGDLPAGIAAQDPGRSPANLELADAQAALGIALSSGRGVVAALRALAQTLELADHDSFVSPSAAIAPGGTRVSRVNIQAEARRLLAAVNSLVAAAELNGANFIASDGAAIRVQTTRFGGTIEVLPQPLDSVGLGLGAPDLDGVLRAFRALDDRDVTTARAAVGSALDLAQRRLQNLEALQRGLGFSSAQLQSFAAALSGDSGLLPRGSVIDTFG